ncbi:Com family DNA-binding transcriptional regulator [Seleniivibrio sp.]|uniref:Com family DNA-binding transcriptional regulator n=1 Tax=Seleniivibrio sp. TaxID=2898801 RepID=UPI0025D2D286|nr:Com family DNA-binding transcriptional regulator [Seleniivibrio sp.]MCD8553495.1 Com family DNA-binding transcriptional regulator [Seleniivibrio sp.]
MKGNTNEVIPLFTEEIRCRRCGRLLMKGHVRAVEVKCPKCGYIQVIAAVTTKK